MGEIPRKADGRRIFSVEFKREAVGRVSSGGRTLAELSRELEVQPSQLGAGQPGDGGAGERPYNHKRIRRVMRLNDLMLPGKIRRRINRPHTGKVSMPSSNQRWCSDGFNIECWNGETVRAAFALDCHDREAIEHVAEARELNGHDIRLLLDRALWAGFDERVLRFPIEIQWLSDNGDGI